MIRKLFFILLLFGILTHSAYGQESFVYKSNMQTKALFGANIPLTKLLQGANVDNLLRYDDHYFYWQPISFSYFFHKYWGLEFNYQIGYSGRIRKRDNNFKANMQSEYSDKYYVHTTTGDSDEIFFLDKSFLNRGYLGLIYRFETTKFYIYPKLSIGVTSLYTDWGRTDLKEKNSNYGYKISYSSNEINDYFTLASSISFGYKVFHRLYINADIMLSYFKTNIVFEKEFTNLYIQQTDKEYFNYNKDVFTLSLGAGLIYIISFKKK